MLVLKISRRTARPSDERSAAAPAVPLTLNLRK